MDSDFIVYEPATYDDEEDLRKFEESLRKLETIGIEVERIMCTEIADIPSDSESHELVKNEGMDALPITEYMGVVVSDGKYPDDQTLADYLDVPDGVLSADRKGAPAQSNDLPPACSCGTKGAIIPK